MTRTWTLALVAALAATGTAAGPAAAQPETGLPAFGSCDELVAHMRELVAPKVGPYGLPYALTRRTAGGGWMRPAPPPPAGPYGDRTVDAAKAVDKAGVTVNNSSAGNAASAATKSASGESAGANGMSGPAVGPGATGTNRQEQEVAEADIAQTDGRTVVSLRNGKLRVFTLDGDRPRARGALALGPLTAHELLLSGDRVLVVGRLKGQHPAEGRWHQLGLSLVDIAHPAHPRLLGTQAISGTHVSTRMVGGVARIVLSSSPYLVFRAPGYRPDADERARERNRRAVRDATVSDWLPTTRAVRADGSLGPAKPLLRCTDVRRPAEDSGFDLLSVLTLDLARPFWNAAATGVVTAGELVYASADHLYVATTRDRRTGTPYTAVHSFATGSGRRTVYTGSGGVPGTLLGRWAMSEHGGDLRVVSTWLDKGYRTETGIVVLRPEGGQLLRAGAIGGIGRGERVYAVRWFDALAAVVTYRQVDPLHLVDLTDPRRPRLRGELEVPGFSEYLHPIGGGRLLGVGQGPDADRNWGLQVSAFDVADPDPPVRNGSLHLGAGSSSGVQSDARRFLYLPDLRTVVLPVAVGGENGLVAVRIGADFSLTKAATWESDGASAGSWEWRPRLKTVALPGGLIGALDGKGLTVLSASDLAVHGFAAYPKA